MGAARLVRAASMNARVTSCESPVPRPLQVLVDRAEAWDVPELGLDLKWEFSGRL